MIIFKWRRLDDIQICFACILFCFCNKYFSGWLQYLVSTTFLLHYSPLLPILPKFKNKLWKSVCIHVEISCHCVKSVQIWSFFWSVYSRTRTEYVVSPRIQSECGKIRTRKISVFGHFSCSVYLHCWCLSWIGFAVVYGLRD